MLTAAFVAVVEMVVAADVPVVVVCFVVDLCKAKPSLISEFCD